MWDDHDEDCHGPPDAHINDPGYEDGFMWSCCEKEIYEEGCIVSKHEPKDIPAPKKTKNLALTASAVTIHLPG